MSENYIPHKNLEEPSNIIENSKRTAKTIFNNNNNFEEIKQQIRNQNDYINDLKNELELSDNDININSNNLGNYNTENIKLTIYQQLAIASNQLLKANEHIKFLIQENNSLKKIIENKDKIISDFEQLSLQTKSKFERLEQINNNLKKQLQLLNIRGNKRMDDINGNIYDLKSDFYYQKQKANNQRIIDDINNNEIYPNYIYNNENNNEEQNKCLNSNFNNFNLQMKNDELIASIINIKKDLESIENDYKINIKEKDCYIEQLNCELINVYKEYVKLSDILEELNYIVKNSDYNELKTEFNCLLREKEILLKEKEKNHMEIISLREKFARNPYDCKSSNKNQNSEYNELMNIFSEKEKNYINEIDNLKDNLMKKIKEIEELKNRQKLVIREYELKIETLLKNRQ